MTLSFIISYLAIKNIFISSSPRLRPNLGPYLVQQASAPISLLTGMVSNTAQSLSNVHLFTLNNLMNQPASPAKQDESSSQPTSSASPRALVQAMQSIPFNTLEPGIYSKEETHTSYLLIKEQEVQWQDYALNSNGKQIIIRVPKGEQQPDKNIINKIQ